MLDQVAKNVNLQMMEEWYVIGRSDLFSAPVWKLYKILEGTEGGRARKEKCAKWWSNCSGTCLTSYG